MRKTVLMLTLATWGLSAGLAYQLYQDGRSTERGVDPSGPAPGAAPSSEPLESWRPEVSLVDADKWLEAGDAAAALGVYEAYAGESAALPAGLGYRMAGCLELLGHADAALQHYSVLTEDASAPSTSELGMLGQIRCWIVRGELATAQALACRLLHNQGDSRIRSQAYALLAEAVVRQTLEGDTAGLLAPAGVAAPRFRITPADLMLGQARGVAPADASPQGALSSQAPSSATGDSTTLPRTAAGEVELRIVARFGDKLQEIQANIQAPRRSLVHLVEEIGAVAELSVHWTSQLEQAVAPRTASLSLTDVSLAEALDLLLLPHGLLWSVQENALRIEAWRDSGDPQQGDARSELAERCLQRAIAAVPDESRAAPCYLWLGNLAAKQGNLELAVNYYDQINRQYPRSPVGVRAEFNAAKALFTLGEKEACRQSFYHVIDRGGADPLDAISYLYLARMLIDGGQARRAVQPLTRALVLSSNEKILDVAALTLAGCYLTEGSPTAALTTLAQHRASLAGGDGADAAAFLTALARFRSTDPESNGDVGRTLVNTVAHVVPEDFFGDYGYLLLGAAYDEIGLPERMAAIYEVGLAKSPAPWVREKMGQQLADHFLNVGKLAEARATLEALARDTDSLDGSQAARIRLAEIHLDLGDDDACLAACEALLETADQPEQHVALLKLMGAFTNGEAITIERRSVFPGSRLAIQDRQINNSSAVPPSLMSKTEGGRKHAARRARGDPTTTTRRPRFRKRRKPSWAANKQTRFAGVLIHHGRGRAGPSTA